MFSPRFAKYLGYVIGVLLFFVFLSPRIYGWWTWKQYNEGRGTHEGIACTRCAEALSRFTYGDDLTYERERHNIYNQQWVDIWNRNWYRCYAVFPQYPWRISP